MGLYPCRIPEEKAVILWGNPFLAWGFHMFFHLKSGQNQDLLKFTAKQKERQTLHSATHEYSTAWCFVQSTKIWNIHTLEKELNLLILCPWWTTQLPGMTFFSWDSALTLTSNCIPDPKNIFQSNLHFHKEIWSKLSGIFWFKHGLLNNVWPSTPNLPKKLGNIPCPTPTNLLALGILALIKGISVYIYVGLILPYNPRRHSLIEVHSFI